MILKTIRQSWIFTTIQIKVCQSNGKWICQQNLKHIPKESCIISDFYILARALPILGVGLLLSSVRRAIQWKAFVCVSSGQIKYYTQVYSTHTSATDNARRKLPECRISCSSFIASIEEKKSNISNGEAWKIGFAS